MNHGNIGFRMRFLLGSLLSGALLLVAGCGNNQKEGEDQTYEEHQAEDAEATVVRLDRHKVFHAGIRVAPVQKKSVAIPLTLSGKVTFNERKLAEITSRVSGRVEKVRVFTNDKVSQGDILMELYSQEYLTIQHEFLQAADRWKRTKLTAGGDTAAAKAIYLSALRRLNVIGISTEEIQELESGQQPATYYHVRAPFRGTILESKARFGSFVQVGSELFDFADLSTLWVLADIYEKDLSSVQTGMKALVEVVAYPDLFRGVITTINGVVDEKTRTVKARVEVDNKSGRLKPEMFCSVKIETTFGSETIKIPASALLGETEKHFVFVSVNDTTFQKRDVRTGVETREFAEILDGLLIGEMIVVGGGFFLKSELAKETFGEEH